MNKLFKFWLCAYLITPLLASCEKDEGEAIVLPEIVPSNPSEDQDSTQVNDSIYPILVGGDISLLPAYEKHNSAYLDQNGKAITDVLQWLVKECQWNTFRVRLFVNPNQMSNDGTNYDPAVCQDLDYVTSLGKRIKNAGAQFVLDLHYSDTWVDAGHIQAPVAWKSLSNQEMADQVGSYTKEVLTTLVEANAVPDMVQVGNEIMYGMVGIPVAPYEKAGTDWNSFLNVLKTGCKAVREACPNARIILHTDRPGNAAYANYWYGKADEAGVDYDIIGLSYYPFWHGTLTNLRLGLDNLAKNFPSKSVQIVETGYYFQHWPTSDINYDTRGVWAATPEGQYTFVSNLIETLSNYPQVNGLYYWNPEDAGNGDDTDWSKSKATVTNAWSNRGLWDPKQSQTGHKIIQCEDGDIPHLLGKFATNNRK